MVRCSAVAQLRWRASVGSYRGYCCWNVCDAPHALTARNYYGHRRSTIEATARDALLDIALLRVNRIFFCLTRTAASIVFGKGWSYATASFRQAPGQGAGHEVCLCR